jgi:hypothetical protein
MASRSTQGPAVTKKSVSDIKGLLLRPALTSHYLCQFYPPNLNNRSYTEFINQRINSGFTGARYSDNQELIELSCSEATLPGSSIATYDINDSYHGVSEKIAYRRLYDDRADFTFYVDHDYNIIQFFENWISYITFENDISSQKETTFTYRAEYKSNYQTSGLSITKFERDYSGKMLTYRFIGAYPISINSMPVSYDSSQLLKCTVSFSYLRYVIELNTNIPGSKEPSLTSGDNSLPKTSDYFNNPTSIRIDEYYNSGNNGENNTNWADFYDGSNRTLLGGLPGNGIA